MKESIEIEYKTKITENKYIQLLNALDLNNNIYTQTNYYFDSLNEDLVKNKIVLRIRQKKDQYKLTSKIKDPNNDKSTLETHLYLYKEKALDMINNGFNASIINLNYDVYNICSLTTHRTKKEFLNGTIFLDKSEYNGIIDYELEYEAKSVDTIDEDFKKILIIFNIPYQKQISKFKRCYLTK